MNTRSRFLHLLLAGTLAVLVQMVLPVWAEVTVTPEEIAEKVTKYIQDSTPVAGEETKLDVELLKLPFEPITLSGDQVTFLLSDSRPTPLTFRTIVQLTMTTESDSRQIGIPVKLALEKPVWVAKHLIPARQAITANDVILLKKRLEHDSSYALGANDPVGQYSSRINLPAGSVLDVRKLVKTPAVYRNSDVRLVLAMGNGVRINVYAKALENGVIGERIRVRQQLADHRPRIYTAEVIGKNTVLVRM